MFCSHCGAQLADGTTVCAQCGNEFSEADAAEATAEVSTVSVAAPTKKKKKILLIIIAAVAVALIVVGFIFIQKLVNNAKADALEQSLVGDTYTYTNWMTYSYMQSSYTFKENNLCEEKSVYSALDSITKYDRDYEIDYISDDEIILKIGYKADEEFISFDKFLVELNYGRDGIKSFVNVDDDAEIYK